MRKFVMAVFLASAGLIFVASASGAGVVPQPPGIPSGGFSLTNAADCSTRNQFPAGKHFLSAEFTATADGDDDDVDEQINYTYYMNSDFRFTGDYTITIGLSNGTTLLIEEAGVTVGPTLPTEPVGSVAYTVVASDAGAPLTATVTEVSVFNTGNSETVTCAPTRLRRLQKRRFRPAGVHARTLFPVVSLQPK